MGWQGLAGSRRTAMSGLALIAVGALAVLIIGAWSFRVWYEDVGVSFPVVLTIIVLSIIEVILLRLFLPLGVIILVYMAFMLIRSVP
jgi:hypothetical protein